jgi:hypothetical protein
MPSAGERYVSCYAQFVTAALQHDCPSIDPALGLYVRTLHRACEKLGGVRALATHLRVSPMAVIRWLDGASPVPQPVFLAAVDTILASVPDRRRSPRNEGPQHRY